MAGGENNGSLLFPFLSFSWYFIFPLFQRKLFLKTFLKKKKIENLLALNYLWSE